MIQLSVSVPANTMEPFSIAANVVSRVDVQSSYFFAFVFEARQFGFTHFIFLPNNYYPEIP